MQSAEPLTREAALHREMRAQIRAQRRKEQRDPDHVETPFPIWVAYGWSPKRNAWYIVGFLRRKPTPARMRRFRKKSKVPAHIIMKYVELFEAQRKGGPKGPPMRYVTTRPAPAFTMPLRCRDTVIPLLQG